MRDIDADYKAAYLADYEAYRQAGRDKDADRVARILRDQYGHDVAAADDGPVEKQEPQTEPVTPETTAAARPPEAAVEPKPPAKKTAPARKTAVKKTAAPGKD